MLLVITEPEIRQAVVEWLRNQYANVAANVTIDDLQAKMATTDRDYDQVTKEQVGYVVDLDKLKANQPPKPEKHKGDKK